MAEVKITGEHVTTALKSEQPPSTEPARVSIVKTRLLSIRMIF